MNATSLNTASHSVPSVIGPALGGLLVGGVGVGVAYFATSGAHLAAAMILLIGGGGQSRLPTSGVATGRPSVNSSLNSRFTNSGAPTMYETQTPSLRA